MNIGRRELKLHRFVAILVGLAYLLTKFVAGCWCEEAHHMAGKEVWPVPTTDVGSETLGVDLEGRPREVRSCRPSNHELLVIAREIGPILPRYSDTQGLVPFDTPNTPSHINHILDTFIMIGPFAKSTNDILIELILCSKMWEVNLHRGT